jgi:Rrf2 family protein
MFRPAKTVSTQNRPMLSQTAEYALRATLYLAEHPDGSARVGDLAAALEVPQNYLSKTLHQLARAEILTSTRGKHGGFRLARPAGEIRLLEIVAPFERFTDSRQCLLGSTVCSDVSPCAAHSRWKEVKERSNAFFRDTTLKDLIRPSPPVPLARTPAKRPRA